jgi:hypothetical protein
MLDFLKNKFPGKPTKWAGWVVKLESLDIDTVKDVREITDVIWLDLELSPVLKSGLSQLRAVNQQGQGRAEHELSVSSNNE